MKINYKQIEPFVAAPNPAARVILVYGPDSGLMKERAKTMGKTVVEDLNDPFNAVTLSASSLKEDPAKLIDEAGAISMMGGDRLLRVTDAGDNLTTLIKEYLGNPQTQSLIILEAGELGPRSSLRKLCEKESNAAAIPCYIEDERDLARFIRSRIQEDNKSIDQDAITWLASNISGDRGRVRSELEKLLIYKGEETSPITLQDTQNACGQAGAQNLDDISYAVGGGQAAIALRVYHKLLDEGIPFIVILRTLQNHFRRLHMARSRADSGEPIEIAIKSLRPPIFFKKEAAFREQIQRWQKKKLDAILGRLMDVEAECKQTGAPVETLCAQTVLGISAMR